jgi:hypothetical protein
MKNITFSTPTPEQLASGELSRRLHQFNYGVVGKYPEVLKNGYEEYARIDEFVQGKYLVLMKKALAG